MTTDSPEETTSPPAETPENATATDNPPEAPPKKTRRKSAAKTKRAKTAKAAPTAGEPAEKPEISAENSENPPEKAPAEAAAAKKADAAPAETPESGENPETTAKTAETTVETAQNADSTPNEANKPPAEPKEEVKELPPAPEFCDLNELHGQPLAELHKLAGRAGFYGSPASVPSTNCSLSCSPTTCAAARGWRPRASWITMAAATVTSAGRATVSPRCRTISTSTTASCANSASARDCPLRCKIKPPREKDKFFTVERVLSIEGTPIDDWEKPKKFDDLTALFPKDRIILETAKDASISSRIVDLIAPLGKGQRGLINAPPRGGKTLLLKDIAASIHKNYPDVELLVLLLDERPEEVTDFTETVNVPVFSSTFDEQPQTPHPGGRTRFRAGSPFGRVGQGRRHFAR